MNIAISNTSEKPIYQQLFEQLSAKIIKGEFETGYGLPPIRQAAKELRVSIITVKKAWEELDRCGLIYTVTGKGCFVSDLTPEEMLLKRDDMIRSQMSIDVSYYKSLGLSLDEAIDLIKDIY
jgi:GntR family transcriptional regulator